MVSLFMFCFYLIMMLLTSRVYVADEKICLLVAGIMNLLVWVQMSEKYEGHHIASGVVWYTLR